MRGCSFSGLPMLAHLEREKGMIMLVIVCMHKGLKARVCEHLSHNHIHNNLHKINTKMCPLSPWKCMICTRSISLPLRTQKCF